MTESEHLPDRRVVVTALGVTQILAWGSTFYLLAVLAPYIARDTGWTYDRVVIGASVGLFVAGLVSPRVGRFISSHGGRPVLAIGALLLAAGLAALGAANSFPIYLAAWAVIGAGMGASLYDAAFSTLGNIYGSNARPSITAVTLFGGFASTVCWPLSAYLVEHLGWREACFVYAAIQIAISLPLHLLALPRGRHVANAQNGAAKPSVHLQPGERGIFAVLAIVVTIGAAFLSIIGTHLLPLLQARGLDLALAVSIRCASWTGASRRARGRNARRPSLSPIVDHDRVRNAHGYRGGHAVHRLPDRRARDRALWGGQRHRHRRARRAAARGVRCRSLPGAYGTARAADPDRDGSVALSRWPRVPARRGGLDVCDHHGSRTYQRRARGDAAAADR